jgi:hypothetical protein
MIDGANSVTVAPGVKAAAAADKWLLRVQNAKPKFINNVKRVSLEDWKASYINIGVPRVSQGAQAKQNKVLAFHQEFIPFLQRGAAKIDAMPSATLADGINRAVAQIQYNATFKRGSSG